jgi:hypothetical protein
MFLAETLVGSNVFEGDVMFVRKEPQFLSSALGKVGNILSSMGEPQARALKTQNISKNTSSMLRDDGDDSTHVQVFQIGRMGQLQQSPGSCAAKELTLTVRIGWHKLNFGFGGR